MKTLSTPTSNSKQRRPARTPSPGYVVTTARGHRLIVRRPDGRPMRVRPSGRTTESNRVESGQSYLQVPAA